MRKVFERYLRPDEERLLFAAVGGLKDLLAQRDYAWMRLLRHSGIRVGSLARLTVDDAREALASHRLRVRKPIAKGGRAYEVPLNRQAQQALRDLLKARRQQGFPEIGDEPLVMSRKHRGLSVRSFQSRMAHWREHTGLPVEASPHWLRHTLAKRIIARSTARNPLGVVQHALGHHSLNSTGIYTAPDRDELARALEEAA